MSRRARTRSGDTAAQPSGWRRALPEARWKRVLVYLAVAIAYVAVMWFAVFPWADRTFVNRPGLDTTVDAPAPPTPSR